MECTEGPALHLFYSCPLVSVRGCDSSPPANPRDGFGSFPGLRVWRGGTILSSIEYDPGSELPVSLRGVRRPYQGNEDGARMGRNLAIWPFGKGADMPGEHRARGRVLLGFLRGP